MTSHSSLRDSLRFGQMTRSESVAVWPILLVATIGFLTLGSLLTLVVRDTIDRQTDHWIETSLRAAATTGRLSIESKFREAHAIVAMIATRLVIADYLERSEHGQPVAAGITPQQDLAAAMHSLQSIVGISLLDNQGVVVATVGDIPPQARDAFQGTLRDTIPILVNNSSAIKVMAEITDPQGAVLGSELLYYRMDNLNALYHSDLGFGTSISCRVAGVIDGQPRWLIPDLGALPSEDAAQISPLLTPSEHRELILRDVHGAITGIRQGFPHSTMVMALDLDPTLMMRTRIYETNVLTGILILLTTVGALGLTMLLRPFAQRMVRQRQQLAQTVDELRRSEEFNRRITANIPDRIEVLDREGRVVSMSEGGTAAGEVSDLAVRTGARWLSFWSGDDRDRARLALDEARRKNLGRFQGFCDRGSGTSKWWDVAVAPILGPSGAVEELLAVSRDITEEKLAEQKLRETELRYQMVASATNDVIWDWMIDTDQVWWNEAITSQFGYAPEAIGPTAAWWAEQVHPEDLKRVRSGIQEVIASTSSAWRAEYRFRRSDGTYIYVLDRGHVLRDAQGRAMRMIGALFDLSDRRRAIDLEARRALHSQLRADISAALVMAVAQPVMLQSCVETLVRNLDVALARIWILEPGSGTLVLQASAGLYSHLDGAHGRIPVGSFKIGAIAQERTPHLTNQVLGDPRVPDQEWARREHLVAFAGYPLIAGDTLIGVIGMFSRNPIESDTFDSLSAIADLIAQGVRRKTLETRLASQATVMQRTNTELEQFTYVASHDLQEPLRTIANYLALLERRYHDTFDDKAKRYIDHSIEAAKRLQALIKDLLAFSRAGHRESSPLEEIPSHDVLTEVLASLASALSEAKAEVLAEDLPVVRYNRVHLMQLFQNLIGNAIKYRGTTPPRIAVSCRDAGEAWEFSIRDNGIGVDPAYAERIFEVFQRLHGRDQYQGTGIGLALCKKIADSHGGRIWVESALEAGAIFRFTIPK